MSFEFIYDAASGVLAGEKVNGVLIPLMPPPTGDALDELLDECCVIIENMFKSYGKLAGELQMEDGQHSLVLTDGMTRWDSNRGHRGVRSWITEGTLRSGDQLTPVLNAFLTDMKTKLRMRKVSPDWKFDNDALIVIGSRFGLDAPRTLAELRARRAADNVERDRKRQEEEAQRRAASQAFKESLTGREQARQQTIRDLKEDTIRAILDALVDHVTMSPVDPDASEEDKVTRSRQARGLIREENQERRRLEKWIVRPVVEQSNLAADAIVRIYENAEMEWLELEELMDGKGIPTIEQAIENAFRGYIVRSKEKAVLEPSVIPPLMDGVERHLFDSTKGLVEFMSTPMTSGFTRVVRVDDSRTFAVDVVPPELKAEYERQCAMYDEARNEQREAREQTHEQS